MLAGAGEAIGGKATLLAEITGRADFESDGKATLLEGAGDAIGGKAILLEGAGEAIGGKAILLTGAGEAIGGKAILLEGAGEAIGGKATFTTENTGRVDFERGGKITLLAGAGETIEILGREDRGGNLEREGREGREETGKLIGDLTFVGAGEDKGIRIDSGDLGEVPTLSIEEGDIGINGAEFI